MFKKIGASISNALTVGLMGYEVGTHFTKANKEESVVQPTIIETVKSNAQEENHTEFIIIVGIIIVILILAAIAAKILFAKNRLV